MKNLVQIVASAILLLAGLNASADHSSLSVSPETTCTDLLAGQTIDAGDVCFTVQNNETLVVTYTTTDGWELTEAHLWVGNAADGYPATKKGNPKVGSFPYNSGDISGTTSVTFNVPLDGNTDLELTNLDQYCPDGTTDEIYAMAHAAVRKPDGAGGFQTETGWGNGPRVLERGSWATRTDLIIKVTCFDPPQPPSGRGDETAIMYGSIGFDQILATCLDANGNPDNVSDNRWGWQDGPLQESSSPYVNPIYAGAGQNDLAKGTHVGNVEISVTSGVVYVSIVLFPDYLNNPYEVKDIHVYVGTDPVCSANFGNSWTTGNTELTAVQIDTTSGVFVGVHLALEGACNANGNFCP